MKKKFEKPVITKIKAGVPDKYGRSIVQKHISEIDGVAVEELIGNYGSPLYVISEKTIRNQYRDAYRSFSTRYPKVQFAWSYKTNYLDAVCKIYHEEGSWAEVVSGFEFEKALNNGVPGNKIIFNGPQKSKDDLIKAVNHGSYIHIDHFQELFTLIEVVKELDKVAKTAIRINMDTGIYPQWDRFGFNLENGDAWVAITRIMMQEKLHLVGLHTHIGTYIMSPNPYGVAAKKMASLMLDIKNKFDHTINYIDLGGGFTSKNTLKGAYLPGKDTCPSFDKYADAITNALLISGLDINEMPMLFLETGRALIDDAGYILGSVIANKRLSDGRKAMVIDIGVNNLFTSFWYNHDICPAAEASVTTEDTTIYGPLCMNIDIIRDAVRFSPLEPGDHVVIERIGAYNMTQWLQFISYRPNIVLIDENSKTHIIRKKETLSTFTDYEITPDHLVK